MVFLVALFCNVSTPSQELLFFIYEKISLYRVFHRRRYRAALFS